MAKYSGSESLYGIVAVAGWLCLAGCAQTSERHSAPAVVDAGPQAVVEARSEPVAEPPQPLAQRVALKPEAPLRYTVKRGDTLWTIAARYLAEPWQWPEIWYVNDQVRNPHLIYPGDVLTLVWRDGRPLLVNGEVSSELDVEYLAPRAREIPLDEAIPTIPLEAIRDFLRSPRVVSAERLREAPYVLGFADPHLLVGAGATVYAKNLPLDALYRYDGVRLGEKYVDPDSGEMLGWEAVPVADLEVRKRGEPATLVVARSYRETRAGDRLIPPEAESFEANFHPRAADSRINGRIISVFDGVSQIGQYQVVTLSRGSFHGLAPGDVLSVYQSGRTTRDPYTGRNETLPEVFAGTVMVFKVDERVSFALVMAAEREIHLYDRVRAP